MNAPLPATTTTAIIVAAGQSTRMGMDKLLWPLANTPVLAHTITAFTHCPSIHDIIVVCPEDRWQKLPCHQWPIPVTRVDGGAHRHESVAYGLAALPATCSWVAIHDAARPLVCPSDIERCLTAAQQHLAATLAHRITETLKRSDSNDFSQSPVDRSNLWAMQTPQIFATPLILSAYEYVKTHNLTVTDEVSALEAIQHPVKLVESSQPNPKITSPADLHLATALYQIRPS